MSMVRLCVVALFLFPVSITLGAGVRSPSQPRPRHVAGTPVLTYLNINSISTVLRNDGIADIDAQELNSGLVFPRGTGKTAIFQSGFLWGAILNGQIRVGG